MNKSMSNQNPFAPMTNPYAYPYGQPPVIMMPYAPPQQNSSIPGDSMRLLEKMV